MPKIQPWSFTALDTFVTCPKMFYEQSVAKNVKREENTPELLWGNRVHKAFELRQTHRHPLLPAELAEHEPFMQKLDAKPGILWTEQKVALNKQVKPCSFFTTDVWWRGVIDWKKVDGDTACIVDYKTGKVKPNFKQLSLFALHTFAQHPVRLVNAQFYWTTTGETTKRVYSREEISTMWAQFIPDLKQYKEAFDLNVWQPRPSGLCHGWCPVTTCEHWKPKRVK